MAISAEGTCRPQHFRQSRHPIASNVNGDQRSTLNIKVSSTVRSNYARRTAAYTSGFKPPNLPSAGLSQQLDV
jgi:hypothetical protein